MKRNSEQKNKYVAYQLAFQFGGFLMNVESQRLAVLKKLAAKLRKAGIHVRGYWATENVRTTYWVGKPKSIKSSNA